MQKEYLLSELLPGQRATVKTILCHPKIKRRLQDFGFINGSLITCVFTATSGDPSAYRIRGTLLAIRKKDAEAILIRKGRHAYEK